MTSVLFSHGNVLTGDGVGYVSSYDLDANGGRGVVTFTDDLDEALKFEDNAAAFAVWMTTSPSYPVRPDGKPNRPLTAYTVEVIGLDAAAP